MSRSTFHGRAGADLAERAFAPCVAPDRSGHADSLYLPDDAVEISASRFRVPAIPVDCDAYVCGRPLSSYVSGATIAVTAESVPVTTEPAAPA